MRGLSVIVLLSLLALVLSAPAFAIAVSATNHTSSQTNGGLTTYFFPTTPGVAAGGCVAQPGVIPISLDPSRANPTALNYVTGGNWGATNAMMIFQITNSKPLAQITNTGGGAVQPNTASIRVEIGSGPTPLALVPVANTTGFNSAQDFEVDYGQSDNAVVQFGIMLRDVVGGEVSPGTVTPPVASPPNSASGFCTLLAAVIGGGADAAHACAPIAGTSPNQTSLTFAIVKAGSANISAAIAAGFGESTTATVVLADCPPGARAAGPIAIPFNLSLIPGDQRVKVVNNTQPIVDPVSSSVPIAAAVVVADVAGKPLNLGAQIVRTNTSPGGGIYPIDGLVNDTKYCFTVGYVNAAGWVSTKNNVAPNWDGTLAQPNPQACATPEQIDGFLNRSTCFIASAAYGEEWDPRLEVLRQFRDEVLDHYSAGRAFVDWYYSWSPSAAHWLLANPSYKALVRVILLPMVEGARVSLWMRNNMWVFGLMFLLGTFMALTLRRRTT